MTDIFLNWLVETATTKSNHQFTVHRYVDKLFLTFDDPIHIDHVFQTLNSMHQKIKFTKEHERNNKLASLDVQITKNLDCIETSIFRKKTNLGMYTRWDSYVPNRYKRNLVWTLLPGDIVLHRGCSDNPDHKTDCDKTEIMAQTNHWQKLWITEID